MLIWGNYTLQSFLPTRVHSYKFCSFICKQLNGPIVVATMGKNMCELIRTSFVSLSSYWCCCCNPNSKNTVFRSISESIFQVNLMRSSFFFFIYIIYFVFLFPVKEVYDCGSLWVLTRILGKTKIVLNKYQFRRNHRESSNTYHPAPQWPSDHYYRQLVTISP